MTHVDADHVDGIVAMARDIKGDKPFGIKLLWHNTFDDVLANHQTLDIEALLASAAPKTRAFSASVGTGRKLRDLAKHLHIPQNTPKTSFPAKLVARPVDRVIKVTFGGLSLTVLSPTAQEITDLEAEWDRYLKEHPPRAARSGGASIDLDDSVTNLSSIALLAACGEHRLVLAGDAGADQILKGLQAASVLPVGGVCDVDVLKVPHHGSCRNSTVDLFRRVRADHYVFSANGKHGNPDVQTLDMLWEARGEDVGWDVVTTFEEDAWKHAEGKERTALQAAQTWLNARGVKVQYREANALGVAIHLGDEQLD